MSSSDLPDRASLEYLKKLAKETLRELRRTNPDARLSAAQLEVAREHGFPSWRALKAEVDRRSVPASTTFFVACRSGDVATLRELLDREPGLAHERDPDGATGLHAAAAHVDAVRLLLERGADPNARDVGDNALALHFAAGGGHRESVRALLDAGSDVHGHGDLHRLEVIGWATVFGEAQRDVVDLLVARGARHHVFTAVALGDLGLLRRVVEGDRQAIARRLSRFEQEQSALHYAIAPPDGLVGGVFRTGDHYAMVDALIELGADVDARDAMGRTPLEIAMLRGDREAMRRLHAAGARQPESQEDSAPETLSPLQGSIHALTPMLGVLDVDATIAWYGAIGFELLGSHAGADGLDWASVSLGGAEVMFTRSGDPPRRAASGVSLWFRTDRIDDLYSVLKRRQLERAREELTGETSDGPEVRFSVDLYTAFYGQREFGILDPNGVELMFSQPIHES